MTLQQNTRMNEMISSDAGSRLESGLEGQTSDKLKDAQMTVSFGQTQRWITNCIRYNCVLK
jgi:hypothetical protein